MICGALGLALMCSLPLTYYSHAQISFVGGSALGLLAIALGIITVVRIARWPRSGGRYGLLGIGLGMLCTLPLGLLLCLSL